MKKLNIKGYMLVEIIIAFAIAFTLLYFMVDLVFKIKNNNDDLLVETVVKTDSTIITNGLMEYAKTITNKNEAKSFCDKIDVVGKTVKYGEDVIAVVDDTATLGSKNCGFANGRVKVTIPVSVKQIKDENFDIIVDYYYDNGAVCNPIMSYSCSNGKSIDSDVYAIEYDGECEVIDDGNGDWRIKFLEEGKHNLKLNCISLDVDVFLVGGGGGGAGGVEDHYSGGGGGGGSAKTLKNITLVENELYPIVVGAGGKASGGTGGTTSAFGESANGGNGGIGLTGGTGGFGGIGGKSGSKGGDGGNKYNAGKDGINGNISEFDEPSNGVLYGGGGGGGGGGGKYLGNDGEVGFKFKPGGVGGIGGGGVGGDSRNNARYNGGAGQKNTGGGGGGGTEYYNRGTMGSAGGSGIVIIRNARGS